MAKYDNQQGQVLLFPNLDQGARDQRQPKDRKQHRQEPTHHAVLCGSFRKDISALKRSFEELRDLGFEVLSPATAEVVSEKDGFVYTRGEEAESPRSIEQRHLAAIGQASFVWLHAPDGYIGPTATLELGFAHANGIPVFSRSVLSDESLRPFVSVVPSPREVGEALRCHSVPPPPPAVRSFQAYYAKAALERGYEKENAQNCLLLMVEELGELARALRKRRKLRRDSAGRVGDEAEELADVFIYVVHMANILDVDLATAVQAKEQKNIRRFLGLE